MQSDLNGVSNYSVSKQKNQVVQIVNGALAFTPNPATDDASDDQRSTLKVRIDIKDGVVLGTASDTSQAIANWTITGTPPYISLSSSSGTGVTPKTPKAATIGQQFARVLALVSADLAKLVQ